MIVQYRVQQKTLPIVILVHLRCFVVTCLTSFFVFNTVLCFLVCQSECMSVYRRSVSSCVSFPPVVYFCLFSPLKDRICLQLLGANPPDPDRGSGPRPRWETSVPQTPCFAPLANFWLRLWSYSVGWFLAEELVNGKR